MANDAAPTAADPKGAVPDTARGAAPARRCRNCGAPAPDAWCSSCGQETRERLPTLREFAREAAGRYVALDGMLWRTLAALLFRPGHLTREYLAGRRRRFVRPLRLYLATSLLCFLVIGIGADPAELMVLDADPAVSGGGAAGQPADPPRAKGAAARLDGDATELSALADEVAVALPPALRPLETILRQRVQRFTGLQPKERMDRFFGGMRRHAPYAMFVLVPAFAGLLKLVFPRRRRLPLRPSLYGEHLVFAVHNHAFLFVTVILAALLPQPLAALWWGWAALFLLLSLRAVYGGGWVGSVVRALLLAVLYLPLVGIVVGGLVVAAVVIG